jgi:restriction endonuclease S subunit
VKKADILPGYLAWYLNQRPAQIYFDRNAGGTRIQIINKQLLSELEVIVPDLKTQEMVENIYGLHQREQDLVSAIKEKKHKLILTQLLSAVKK